jgi:hypothetical protein
VGSADFLEDRLERAQHRRWREMGMGHIVGYDRKGRPIRSVLGAAEHLYAIANSTVATTAAPVHQPTGAAIRTMLQIEAPATDAMNYVEWGISFDGTSATAVPGEIEFFGCTGAATMSTASASTDVTNWSQPLDTTAVSAIVFGGTTHTGFATAAVTEGTVAAYRLGDLQHISPTTGYVKQWPLGREFVVPPVKLTRVRVTFAATVNAYIYAIWSEA